MKTAKGILILSLTLVLCLGVMGTGMAAGGNGYGGDGASLGSGSGTGLGTGTCINSDIITAELISYTGVVSEVCNYGQGISIDTDGEIVQVYGIGPIRYWENELGIARPDVNDEITVIGKEVTFSDATTKFIAFEITITGEGTIELRDSDTGLPLWRGMGRRW